MILGELKQKNGSFHGYRSISGATARYVVASALHPSRGVDDVDYETATALNEYDYVLAPHRTGSTFYFSKTLGIVRSGWITTLWPDFAAVYSEVWYKT